MTTSNNVAKRCKIARQRVEVARASTERSQKAIDKFSEFGLLCCKNLTTAFQNVSTKRSHDLLRGGTAEKWAEVRDGAETFNQVCNNLIVVIPIMH